VKQATWTNPDNGDKFEVAVKCIKKKHLHGDYEAVLEEIDVLRGLDHPSVGTFMRLRYTATPGLSAG
jgi:calcium/calmodulin-dependent protein kinase I